VFLLGVNNARSLRCKNITIEGTSLLVDQKFDVVQADLGEEIVDLHDDWVQKRGWFDVIEFICIFELDVNFAIHVGLARLLMAMFGLIE
jgi:hypothetical protein